MSDNLCIIAAISPILLGIVIPALVEFAGAAGRALGIE